MTLDEEKDTAAQSIMAVVAIARDNFPDFANVTISTKGKHSASIEVSPCVLAELIKQNVE